MLELLAGDFEMKGLDKTLHFRRDAAWQHFGEVDAASGHSHGLGVSEMVHVFSRKQRVEIVFSTLFFVIVAAALSFGKDGGGRGRSGCRRRRCRRRRRPCGRKKRRWRTSSSSSSSDGDAAVAH